MGGGDLNLKKSWHPSTLRNIERVWKAEQKHEAEQRKIEQLQRELAEERAKEEMQSYAENQGVVKKKEEKLDWMYQGPAALVDREQYLTGRQIDKTFEILQQYEQEGNGAQNTSENDGHISSIFDQGSSVAPVDIANKIREDPLFLIRKQEEEKQKKLLNNPVKLKQLQQMLKMSLSSNKDKKKKKKKHKKHRSSEDESKSTKRRHSFKDEKPTKKSKVLEKKSSIRKSDLSRHHRKRESSDSDSSDYSRRKKKKYKYVKCEKRDVRSDRQNGSYKYIKEEPKQKMSEEEMKRKRQEMMENAVWREKQRSKNVQNYKEDEIKENSKSEKAKPKDFIKPLLSKAADISSVESRIKQNIYNIQRNKGSMDKNFARR